MSCVNREKSQTYIWKGLIKFIMVLLHSVCQQGLSLDKISKMIIMESFLTTTIAFCHAVGTAA